MEQKNILIVDDKESNIQLLKYMLASENYTILDARNGEEALNVVADKRLDLILLDIMMPRIDGFEVCRRLKQDQETRMIPVIIITAMSEKKYRIKAMELGADDLLSEPVDKVELLVRIRSLLRIKSYYDELAESHKELKKKSKEIEDLEKNRDTLMHMIIHDLRSPLTVLCASLEMFEKKGENLSASQHNKLKLCMRTSWEMNELIQSLLDTHKIEAGKLQLDKKEVDFSKLVGEIVNQYKPQMEAKRISLSFTSLTNKNCQRVDPDLMKRVVINLFTNALRHTSEGGKIDVTFELFLEDKMLRLSVKDNGDGLAPEHHQKIFEKYEQVALEDNGNRSGSAGLGLNFCKMVVEAHGGKIWLESAGKGEGASFIFTFPA